MWLFALWLVGFLCSSVALGLTATQLTDEIESGLPIEERPSWRLWKFRRFPWAELQQHRKLYPASRLRKWFVVLVAVQSGLVVTIFAVTTFHPFGIGR